MPPNFAERLRQWVAHAPLKHKLMPEDAKTHGSAFSEDFSSAYANQVRFEPSSWDLKFVFGQLDQGSGAPSTEWHTAMTIPWAQAKLGLYFLQVHVAVYEHVFGKIAIPWDGIPPPPVPPTDEEAEQNPNKRAAYEIMQKLYDQFRASL